MKKVEVNCESKKYNIYIGNNILSQSLFKPFSKKRVIVIAEKKAFHLHKSKLKKLLSGCNEVDYLIFPFSERNKTIKFTEKIYKKLIKMSADRDSLIVSFGGGVTGDVVGFIASTYMRGVSFIQIPTTLLSQTDSSIGGKTGVNLYDAKNIVGTITQPEAVIIDTSLLQTLSNRQIKEGLAEIIKYAITHNIELFKYLEKIDDINEKVLDKLVYESVVIKAKVVSRDEREQGPREILNFGHTIGHALEIISNHKISHGQAVSIGMAYESKISLSQGCLSVLDYEKIISLLKKYKLPIKSDFNVDKLITIMKNDKKNKGKEIMFVLLKAIGSIVQKDNKYAHGVKHGVIKTFLK